MTTPTKHSSEIPEDTTQNGGPLHTLSVFVNNKPGVLGRICQVFSRRGYNIDSLVVANGRNPRFSRMSIGISGHPDGLKQIILQVNKLIDVIHCQEHSGENSVAKELVLIKMVANESHRGDILLICNHFGGKTVDLQEDSLVLMIHGNSDKVDAALKMFSRYEVVETVRTGKVVMARGVKET